jgi:hypothetical protein
MQRTISLFSGPPFRSVLALTLTSITLALAGCGDDPLSPERGSGSDVGVARVAVSPDAATLEVGQVRALHATPTAADGRVLTGRQVSWSSSDPAIASIDAAGAVVARQAGSVWITASIGGRSGTARIEVAAPGAPVESIEPQADSVVLQRGGVRQLGATLRAANGDILTGRYVAWSSESPGMVRVDSAGRILAYHVGTTWITVSSEGKSARIKVIVQSAPEYHLRSAAGQPLPAEVYAGSYTLPDGEVRQVRGTVTDGFLWLTDEGRYLMTVMRVTYENGVATVGNAFYDQGEYTRGATGELHFRSIDGMGMPGGITGRLTETGLMLTHTVYMDGTPVTFVYEKQ